MTAGRLNPDRWYVWREEPGMSFFCAERTISGKREQVYLSAHCLACAKAEILTKHGGRVDLRGRNMQGFCGTWLVTMQRIVEGEEIGEGSDAR